MPSYDFTAGAGIIPTYDPNLPFGYMEAYCNAVGRQIQREMGAPMTRVRVDFGLTATTMEVETTLGFPDSGEFWADQRLLTYTSKTASTFVGVATKDTLERTQIIGLKTEVVLHIPSVPPA